MDAYGDMHMDEDAHIAAPVRETEPAAPVQHPNTDPFQTMNSIQLPVLPDNTAESAQGSSSSLQNGVRNLAVKVHIRKAGRVAWKYVGRAQVVLEAQGNSSRVVVRSITSGKTIIAFSETSEIIADKRGNFIVVASVDGSGVTSWSLNAVNNSDALKLLTSIELACYRCKQAILDPGRYTKSRRRIEKVVREDRRKRHTNKREEDELAAAFGSHQINMDEEPDMPASNPFLFGQDVPASSNNFLNAFGAQPQPQLAATAGGQ